MAMPGVFLFWQNASRLLCKILKMKDVTNLKRLVTSQLKEIALAIAMY